MVVVVKCVKDDGGEGCVGSGGGKDMTSQCRRLW